MQNQEYQQYLLSDIQHFSALILHSTKQKASQLEKLLSIPELKKICSGHPKASSPNNKELEAASVLTSIAGSAVTHKGSTICQTSIFSPNAKRKRSDQASNSDHTKKRLKGCWKECATTLKLSKSRTKDKEKFFQQHEVEVKHVYLENFEAIESCVKQGFAAYDVCLVLEKGGVENLQSLDSQGSTLLALGFSSFQVIRLVSKEGAENNLQSIFLYFKSLRELFNGKECHNQIVRMVSFKGGDQIAKEPHHM